MIPCIEYYSILQCGEKTMDRTDKNLYYSDMSTEVTYKLNSGFLIKYQPDWSWDTKTFMWKDHILWLVFNGRGKLRRIGQRTFSLRKGDCFILRGEEHYLCSTSGAEPLHAVNIHFDVLDSTGKALRATTPPLFSFHRTVDDPDFLKSLMERAIKSSNANQTVDANCWLNAALLEVLRHDKPEKIPATPPGRQRELKEQIDTLCARIAEHPGAPWSVKKMAEELCCCSDHFARLFKQVTGLLPSRFVIRSRIDHARRLLMSTSLPIREVAQLLGYCDEQYFSRQFKSHVGVSPSNYRVSSF